MCKNASYRKSHTAPVFSLENAYFVFLQLSKKWNKNLQTRFKIINQLIKTITKLLSNAQAVNGGYLMSNGVIFFSFRKRKTNIINIISTIGIGKNNYCKTLLMDITLSKKNYPNKTARVTDLRFLWITKGIWCCSLNNS